MGKEIGPAERSPHHCNNCHKAEENKRFSRCKTCKSVYYCSKTCQRQRWGEHKVLCNAIHTLDDKEKRERMGRGMYDTTLNPKTKDSVIKLIGQQCIIDIQLDNMNVKALYDTGAQACLLSERWIKSKKLENEIRSLDELLEARDLVLKTAVETKDIPYTGWIILQLKMEGWNNNAEMNVPFIITSDEIDKPIIGTNVIDEMLKEPEKYNIDPKTLEVGFKRSFGTIDEEKMDTLIGTMKSSDVIISRVKATKRVISIPKGSTGKIPCPINTDIRKMYSKAFTYVGIQVNQNEDKSITVSQNNYIKSIREIKLSSNENVHRVLNKEEVHSTRRAIGQLNWAAGISRPDICFDVSICSSTINNEATVKDAIEINKIIRRIKSDNIEILIPCLDIDSLELKSFCDSSFNNLSKGGSQGAHIVFLCDNTNSCPLQWCSNRIKRVVRSTLAAETLAFIDGSETGIYLSELFTEIYCLKSRLNIKGITDNKSLFQTSNTTKNVDDKRLRVEISMIRQMLERKEIEIIHVKSENNLSNALTKKGASTKTLLATLKCGKISLY